MTPHGAMHPKKHILPGITTRSRERKKKSSAEKQKGRLNTNAKFRDTAILRGDQTTIGKKERERNRPIPTHTVIPTCDGQRGEKQGKVTSVSSGKKKAYPVTRFLSVCDHDKGRRTVRRVISPPGHRVERFECAGLPYGIPSHVHPFELEC